MPNPFEKDWTKSEGHEKHEVEPTSPGTSGGAAFTLGTDGLPQIIDTKDWTLGSLSSASKQQLESLKRILETLPPNPIVEVGGHYHPQHFEFCPGNYAWNDGMGSKHYPRMSEENGDLPEPDQVIVVEKKKD